MRILIADDVPDNIRLISRMLTGNGYQLSAAINGRQALKLARSCAPDLILLDIMMPEMDGYEVCAALKADPCLRAIPVVFLTALHDTEDESRGLALGAVDFITKPFNEAVVRLRVKSHLELKRRCDLLTRLSRLDGLTEIPNRRAFDERLEGEWRRAIRFGEPLAAAMIDIDHFKEYNDAHGHPAGDDCLRRVANVLARNLEREADFIARYGGEEFICLVNVMDAKEVYLAVERLRSGVETLHLPHGASRVSPWVTISIGAALCHPTKERAPAELVAEADAQLFKAKNLGRNRVSFTSF